MSDTSLAKRWGDKAFEKLKSFGFDFFDYNMANTTVAPYTYDEQGFYDFLREEKKRADAAGITIWQVHGPWRCPIYDATPEERAERLEKMKRSIAAAAILGARYWVVHPIMPFGVEDRRLGHVVETRALNLAFMQQLVRAAENEGVTVCLENMPFLDFSLSSPTEIISFVRELDSASFAMCLDTGHANVCREWLTPADALRAYAREICVLHVHDNMGSRDEHLLPFCGTVDWSDFSRALWETGFDGVLSLETAPSPKLPATLAEDFYRAYAKVARAIVMGEA